MICESRQGDMFDRIVLLVEKGENNQMTFRDKSVNDGQSWTRILFTG